ncbi:MAG: hypothetical protein QOJ91_675 [Sphingomonadales bacterium]|jgi:CheY-like chemotaxis protein|nr:hypothetical protein [Sphingomonadales bacterium]
MSLAGVRVLLVEDEAIIAMTAEDMLDELGCTTVATSSNLADAMAATEASDFDIALLDINLNGLDSLPVADRLREAGLPFVFTTGYGAAGRSHAHAEAPLIAKPYQLHDLEKAIREALGR